MEEDIEVDIINETDLYAILSDTLNEINPPSVEDGTFSPDKLSSFLSLDESETCNEFKVYKKSKLVGAYSKWSEKCNLYPPQSVKVQSSSQPSFKKRRKRKRESHFTKRKSSYRNNIKDSKLDGIWESKSNCSSIILGENEELGEAVLLTKVNHVLEEEREIDIEGDKEVTLPITSSLTRLILPKTTTASGTVSKPVSNARETLDEISSAMGYGEGGLTLLHDSSGSITGIIVSKAFKVSSKVKSKRILRKRTDLGKDQLIICKHFSSENYAPFQLFFNLEALLIADIHTYCSYGSAATGLFRGWFELENSTLHITSCTPIGTSGLTICDWKAAYTSDTAKLKNEQLVAGWYFSNPESSDVSTINSTFHKDLQALFTKKSSDPFIMLVLSPYTRTKARCIVLMGDNPYLIDFKTVYRKSMSLVDVKRRMNEAIVKGNRKIKFNKKNVQLNNKTYSQLCYESVRRLLDSVVNGVPCDVKGHLIMTIQHLTGFHRSNS